jgi:hypothetical protein
MNFYTDPELRSVVFAGLADDDSGPFSREF